MYPTEFASLVYIIWHKMITCIVVMGSCMVTTVHCVVTTGLPPFIKTLSESIWHHMDTSSVISGDSISWITVSWPNGQNMEQVCVNLYHHIWSLWVIIMSHNNSKSWEMAKTEICRTQSDLKCCTPNPYYLHLAWCLVPRVIMRARSPYGVAINSQNTFFCFPLGAIFQVRHWFLFFSRCSLWALSHWLILIANPDCINCNVTV